MNQHLTSLSNEFNSTSDTVVYSSHSFNNEELLEAAYQSVYSTAFPRSAGYHSLGGLKKLVTDTHSKNDCRIIVTGENLNDKENRKIKGICISFYYKESDTGQLTYLAVDPTYRTEGIGNKLFKLYEEVILQSAIDNGGTLKGHFITCQNPEKPIPPGHEYDTYDPRKRFNKYVGWGANPVGGDFILGYKIGDKLHVEDHYSLLSFPHPSTKQYPGLDATIAFVKTVWTASVPDAEDQPAFKKMVTSMKEAGKGKRQNNASLNS